MWLTAHITFAGKYTVKFLHMATIPFINILDTSNLFKQETDKSLQKQLWDAASLQKEGLGIITAHVSAK